MELKSNGFIWPNSCEGDNSNNKSNNNLQICFTEQ